MEELVYTSAPQGLQPGSSGFCTVEMTDGMRPEMMDALESLSAYDNDPSQSVNWMHVRLNSVSGVRHVMSRVGPLRGEFSGRTNKLAHHICLAPGELPPQGPMQIVGPGGPLQQRWSGQVQRLKPQPAPTSLRPASMPRVCRSWASAVGDAGVAGAVLARLRQTGSNSLWVIRTPQMDALAMIDEMLALMPGQQRWDMTFCTYLHTLPQSVECRLRWVLPGSPAMQQLQNMGSDDLIDLRNGAESLLGGADDAMIDAARNGTAIGGADRQSPRGRRSLASQGNAAGKRRISQVDLRGAEFASTPSADTELPPPPAEQESLALRWAMIGVALAIIPASLLAYFFMSGDPAPVVAMREVEIAKQVEPAKVAVEPERPEPERPQPPAANPQAEDTLKESRPQPGNDDERANEKPPKEVEQPAKPKPKPETPQTTTVAIRLPTSALSMDLDWQTIHQGSGVYDVTLNRVAPVFRNFEFHLDPGLSGDRNSIAIAITGQQEPVGKIFTEIDRVQFAWLPNSTHHNASAFIAAHEFLIKDDTHQTTVRLDLAKPVEVQSPPVPANQFQIAFPQWVLPEYECWVKPTFFSSVSSEGVQFEPFQVVERPEKLEWFHKSLDISAIEDERLRKAVLHVSGDVTDNGTDRRIRFSTALGLSTTMELTEGTTFEWSQLKAVLKDQVEKHNRPELQKKPAERNLMSYSDRLKNIENWGDSLRCELQLYAHINGRNILWGKTGGEAE